MPIISEGYASTKIQGGSSGTQQEEEPEVVHDEEGSMTMKANVIEQAQVEEITE